MRPQSRFCGIPAAMKRAVVASEDANFYNHEGVDYEAIREAIEADWRKGKFVHGGSTITQQLAKNLYLGCPIFRSEERRG